MNCAGDEQEIRLGDYRIVIGIAGACITARLAPRMKHAGRIYLRQTETR